MHSPPSVAQRISQILAGSHRSAQDRARDAARRPLETLTFFGIDPAMTVVEIWPFFGWYSKIIAPLVKDTGQFIAAVFPPDNRQEYMNRQRQDYIDLVTGQPGVFGNAKIGSFGNGYYDYAPAGCADLIITIRNLHNWMWDADYSGNPRPPYFKAVFESFLRTLKPGGILGVEQHRGDPTVPQDPTARRLYVRQDYAVQMLEEAGFVFLGASEINANPKDTRDHPEGPLSLPPFLRGVPDNDKARYLAIGESDRMTLKFMKPVT